MIPLLLTVMLSDWGLLTADAAIALSVWEKSKTVISVTVDNLCVRQVFMILYSLFLKHLG